MTAGFWSGMNAHKVTSLEDFDDKAINDWLDSVFIDKLNYRHYNKSSEKYNMSHWKVEVVGSRSYTAAVHLDENMKVVQVSERGLSWVHGTLIANKDRSNNKGLEGGVPTDGSVEVREGEGWGPGTSERGYGENENPDIAFRSDIESNFENCLGQSTADEISLDKNGDYALVDDNVLIEESGSCRHDTNDGWGDGTTEKGFNETYDTHSNAMQSGGQVIVEKPLDNIINKELDVRFKLLTFRPLQPEDDLYQAACPDGNAPIERSESGRLIQSSCLGEKHRVVFARNAINRTVFDFVSSDHSVDVNVSAEDSTSGAQTYTPSLNIAAVFSKCMHYDGENLSEGTPAIDLSLHVDTEPLIKYMKKEKSRDFVESWLEKVIDHILLVNDTIRRS